MNPVVVDIGALELREYTAWLMGGILAGLLIIGWRAYATARDPAAIPRWLDVGIAALVAGLIGARALHVALEWDYFADRTDEIDNLRLGGMAWHGGLIAAIPAAWLAARLRGVPFRAWADAAALAIPLGLIGAWRGCRYAGCGYGYEVQTLADWPGWMVEELPDVFGLIAPRLDVQVGGMIIGGVLWALAAILTWRSWLAGLRLWVVLALAGLALLILGYLRADPAQMLFNRRADQVFNALLAIGSTLIGAILWLWDRRNANPVDRSDDESSG